MPEALTEIRRDFADYTDPSGMISGDAMPKSASGNGILYTAEMYFILAKNGALAASDRPDFWALIARNCQLLPGLYSRGKGWNDQEGIDDYIGLAAASRLLGTDHARDILRYGRNPLVRFTPFRRWPRLRWYFENEQRQRVDDTRAWFGRFPAFICHVTWAAGETPAIWLRLWWAVTVAITGLFSPLDQDQYILSWLMMETIDSTKTYWFERWASRFYIGTLHKNWSRGMRDVLACYFGSQDHPIAKWWKD